MKLVDFDHTLRNRKQCSHLSGIKASIEEVGCGVSQGSCLGPPLFLTLINDSPRFCPKKATTPSIFADDTGIMALE